MENVRFLGRVAPEELRRYYEHAIALVVPSVCFETFGIILIEAFKQGTPVIARRIGPFPEIVAASGGAELFSTREELAVTIRRLQEEPEARQALARAGYRGFLVHWTERAVVPRYLGHRAPGGGAEGRQRRPGQARTEADGGGRAAGGVMVGNGWQLASH